jgi:hypothetical protein
VHGCSAQKVDTPEWSNPAPRRAGYSIGEYTETKVKRMMPTEVGRHLIELEILMPERR